MRFLVDAQLPAKLCEILVQIGFDAVHVDDLLKGDASTDREITIHADENELIVISKDADFYHMHMILGQPRKLLLITTGNIKNRKLFDIFRDNALIIKNLFGSCNYVELTNKGLIGHEK